MPLPLNSTENQILQTMTGLDMSAEFLGLLAGLHDMTGFSQPRISQALRGAKLFEHDKGVVLLKLVQEVEQLVSEFNVPVSLTDPAVIKQRLDERRFIGVHVEDLQVLGCSTEDFIKIASVSSPPDPNRVPEIVGRMKELHAEVQKIGHADVPVAVRWSDTLKIQYALTILLANKIANEQFNDHSLSAEAENVIRQV
jgi:hypothetical protein